MASTVLFESGDHHNILLEDFGHGEAVQANQHLIIDGKAAIILDPGGHKVYNKAMSETVHLLKGAKLEYIFCSHQDPDIVAALNGWLMTTDATAYAPALWLRFIPHFGLDSLVADHLKPIPDQGMRLKLGATELIFLPAHFLHSCGNFHIYDPTSKILYSGDLGASIGMDYYEVKDFDQHLQYMEGFHKRYMASNQAMRQWAKMVRNLDIEMIAPQHGAYFKGKELSTKFIDWVENLECGVDLMDDVIKVPA